MQRGLHVWNGPEIEQGPIYTSRGGKIEKEKKS